MKLGEEGGWRKIWKELGRVNANKIHYIKFSKKK